MTTTTHVSRVEGPFIPLKHTIEQYESMMRDGAIMEGDPYELLDGQVVRKLRSAEGEDPMTIGFDHATSVKKFARLDAKLVRLGCHVTTQQPITLPPFDVPEPDGAIIRGAVEDYEDVRRHPVASDVLCVLEVADASLARDRGYKLRLYANAGLPMYVIINLLERVAEVYTEPMKGMGRYGKSVTLQPKGKLMLPTVKGDGVSVAVEKLLP